MSYRAQSPLSGAVHRQTPTMKGNERKPQNLAQGSWKEQTRTPANTEVSEEGFSEEVGLWLASQAE